MVRRKAKTTTGLSNPKSTVNLAITPEAKDAMDIITKQMGLTRSALFEGLLNGSISLSNHTSEPNSTASFNDDNSAHQPQENISDNTQELADYKNKISVLEKELETQKNLLAKQEEINTSIQKELDSTLSTIKALETQLQNAQNTHNDSEQKIAQLQQVINEKEGAITKWCSSIASLEAKINPLENDLKIANESVLKSKEKEKDDLMLIEQLKHQLEEKNYQVYDLEKRVNQTTYNQNLSHQLTMINEQQKQTIIYLEKRISELETVASIGQQTLNKWRSKMF